jgi:hypothetical protein
MKLLAALLVATFSMSSFAISTEKLVKACQKVGTEKVVSQAKEYGLKVNPGDVRECGVDNRPLNPTKYVWFCAITTGDEETISKLTQKPLFGDCF